MASDNHNVLEREISSWLKSIIEKQGVVDFSLEISGTSEKGDGYIGDIVFVKVNGKNLTGEDNTFNWVLKCGKRSGALRNTFPVRDAFLNEIVVYDTIFPNFVEYQQSKKVQKYFNNFPKCYGTLLFDEMEVIVLENLKPSGYDVWERQKPLPLKHLKMILALYGKWHATSAAMIDQQPERFKELANKMDDVFIKFYDSGNSVDLFGDGIDQWYDVCKDSVDENTSQKFLRLKNFTPELKTFISKTCKEAFKVISHGDCWNNNFMFKSMDDINFPTDVAIIDWQMSCVAPPVFDVSYFLYSCISEQDLQNFDELLKFYHDSFSSHVKALGSNPEKLYSYEKFLSDWKSYSRFGITMAIILIKLCLSEKDEVRDISETIEKGLDVTETFRVKLKDTKALKARSLFILKHIVEREFI